MAVTALGALTTTALPAHATEIVVPCDTGALVRAVHAANATADPDVLSLAADCVYSLTEPADTTWSSGLPPITGGLTINGNNATITRAPGAPRFRIIFHWSALELDKITITGGHTPDGVGTNAGGDGKSGEDGGGIQSWGPLTVVDSSITGNATGKGAPGADATATTPAGRGGSGGAGAGILSYTSATTPVTIINSSITGNTTGDGARGGDGTDAKAGGRGGSGGSGGGLYLLRGAVLQMTGSSVEGNATGNGGQGGYGGHAARGGSGGEGAGIMLTAQQGKPLKRTITGSTVTGNQAGHGGDAGVAGPSGHPGDGGFGGSGGGVALLYDALTLDHTTVGGNTAGEPGAGGTSLPAAGGGLYLLRSQVTLLNGAEISGNRPDDCYAIADVPSCPGDPSTARGASAERRIDDATAEVSAAGSVA